VRPLEYTGEEYERDGVGGAGLDVRKEIKEPAP